MKTPNKLGTKTSSAARIAGTGKRMWTTGPRKRLAKRESRVVEIRSILVPIDFSAASEKAIAYAVPLARLCGARLTLVHVVEPIVPADFASSFPITIDNDKVNRECKKRLDDVVAALKIQRLVDKLLVRTGRAFNEITSAARTLKADLIIISTHGRTGLKHALMGSTAERVVQHAPCPVLVVRPNEREFLKSTSK